MKGFKIKLKVKEVKILKALVSKGTEKARKITRCRILLLCHAKHPKGEIALSLSIDPHTVTSVCRRYLEEGLEAAINEKPRPGAPTIFDGKLKAKITALACSTPPEGRSQWSLRLLSDKAVELDLIDSISHTDIGRILKKTKLNLI
jgi:hypothetical protein